jgi:uncharacterized repeat protein (TIGR02543 family)
MKKSVLLVLSSLLILPLAGCTKPAPIEPTSTAESESSSEEEKEEETIDPDYPIVFDEHVRLRAGEITSRIGVHFHFDEKTVYEDSEEGFLTLGPFGGIYLQNYIPGLKQVVVDAKYDGGYFDEGGYVVGISSTPNSVEHYNSTQTSMTMTITLDKPYLSIINRGNKDLIIESIKFKYEETPGEEELHDLIHVEDQEAKLDLEHPIKPYELNPIDESKIPENRVVTKIGPEEYTLPGEYTYGYEVHAKLEGDVVGKLLYSSTANFKVSGTTDNKHIAVFHLEDHNVLIPVNDGELVDYSSNVELRTYNWNDRINDLSTPLTSDRHFYPVFNVVGVPTDKDGDGCHPVHTTYSLFTGKVEMPDPVMKEGYQFGGWFLDHACTQVFDPEARHSGNITLYAKCIETTRTFRKVFYYDYDTQLLNRIDYLYEEENYYISLPKFDDIGSRLPERHDYAQTKGYEVRVGANRLKIIRPEGEYPYVTGTYAGDHLEYETVKDFAGDIKLNVVRLEVYSYPEAQVLRFFTDLEENTVMSGLAQEELTAAPDKEDGIYDRILAARYIDHDPDWQYTYNTYYDPVRADSYLITDEVNGYISDGGLFTSISSHGYGNKYTEHAKPLYGLLRHDSVIRVHRRAFFNRYGLLDTATYFPQNAREFDLEAYANTHFNENLLMPKNLKKIGTRCFVGSTNIHNVFLPLTLNQVGEGAFSIAEYDELAGEFKNIRYRNENEKITFYFEGSEAEFNRLDDKTKLEITSNASKIIYDFKYDPCYSK